MISLLRLGTLSTTAAAPRCAPGTQPGLCTPGLRTPGLRTPGISRPLALALLLPALTGCMDTLSDVDARTSRLRAIQSESLLRTTPTPDRGAYPSDFPNPRSQLTRTEPPSVNPPVQDLKIQAADTARDVAARLATYTAEPDNATSLDLPGVWRQAQQGARELFSAEEEYILASIAVLIARRDFEPRPFATVAANFSRADISSTPSASFLNVVNTVGLTQNLPFGGSVAASFIWEFTRQLRDLVGQDYVATSSFQLSAAVPLLRDFGDIAREDLIQAERNLVYEARQYEEFRRAFLIDIAGDYFALVQQQKVIRNQQGALASLQNEERRQRALVEAGRSAEFQLNIALSDVLNAQSALAAARETYVLSLDNFKVRLGIPLSTPVRIVETALDFAEPDVTPDLAMEAALRFRLDLQTSRDAVDDARRGVRNARNQLLPDLDVAGSVDVSTEQQNFGDFFLRRPDSGAFTGSVTLGLPLDRVVERLALRSASIAAAQAERSFTLLRDDIIVDSRAAIRNVELSRFQLNLAERAVEINRRRALEQQLKADEVDAQQIVDTALALQNSENARDAAVTDLRNAILSFLVTTGQLRVTDDGQLQQFPGLPPFVVQNLAPTPVPGQPDAVPTRELDLRATPIPELVPTQAPTQAPEPTTPQATSPATPPDPAPAPEPPQALNPQP